MQKLTQSSSTASQNKNLSIQFSLDGFSFCIKDDESKEILQLSEYVFETTLNTPFLLLEKVKTIFETDEALQGSFKSVRAIHQNNLASQIPKAYFDENNLKSYLNYNIKTLSSDYITYDELPSLNANNVYIPYVNINNFLFKNFGEFTYEHHSTLLINELTQQFNNSTEDVITVNIAYNTIEMVVFKKGVFHLYNSFTFKTKEDFLYYILFTSEQLNLKLEELVLVFLGNITTEFSIYKAVEDYIKNIRFLEPNHDFLEKSEYFFPHSNYILLS